MKTQNQKSQTRPKKGLQKNQTPKKPIKTQQKTKNQSKKTKFSAKRNSVGSKTDRPTTKAYKLGHLRNRTLRRTSAIQEIVREPTSGGIVFRMTPDNKDIEILLIQDSKNRWTIPKGHIEQGETAKETAIREIGEEAGLQHIKVLAWLGKIHFKYRRVDRLVLMTTQIYLVRSVDQNETPTKEKWMHSIKWFSFNDALDAIEYEDIEKLMLIARKKIRAGEV